MNYTKEVEELIEHLLEQCNIMIDKSIDNKIEGSYIHSHGRDLVFKENGKIIAYGTIKELLNRIKKEGQ